MVGMGLFASRASRASRGRPSWLAAGAFVLAQWLAPLAHGQTPACPPGPVVSPSAVTVPSPGQSSGTPTVGTPMAVTGPSGPVVLPPPAKTSVTPAAAGPAKPAATTAVKPPAPATMKSPVASAAKPAKPEKTVAPGPTSGVVTASVTGEGKAPAVPAVHTEAVVVAADGTVVQGGESGVVPAGCSSCSGGLLSSVTGVPAGGADGGCVGCGGCSSCDGCACCCVPGHKPCCCDCEGAGPIGRVACAFINCICCQDHCYEPHWTAAADAAFWQDAARPVTQMRIGFQGGYHFVAPDRSEYYFKSPGAGAGPKAATLPAITDGSRPVRPATGEIKYTDIFMINETAEGKFSLTITPVMYRSFNDSTHTEGASGYGDIYITAKTMYLDCELMQFSTQLKTYIPSGNFLKGLGTGHASLEPAMLMTVKLMPDAYFQGEVAEWIPLGGDDPYQGGVLHYHFSMSDVFWRPLKPVQFVGVVELNGYAYQSGNYAVYDNSGSKVVQGPGSSGATFINGGPGVRIVICDQIDFGFAAAFKIDGDRVQANEQYKFEFRWRF